MNTDVVISLATQAMNVAFKVAMPLLLAGLVVGLIVSVFQAVTQIQEMTLAFIPKIIAIGVVLVVWELRFGWQTQVLARRLAAENRLPDDSELPRRASGRVERDAADAHFEDAYAWRQQWPTVTESIANVAMTAEEFQRSLAFYDRTLELEPNSVGLLDDLESGARPQAQAPSHRTRQDNLPLRRHRHGLERPPLLRPRPRQPHWRLHHRRSRAGSW